MTAGDRDQIAALVERLNERTALKYIGNCKCGRCQLVSVELVSEARDALSIQAARIAELEEALRTISGMKYNRDTVSPDNAYEAFSRLNRQVCAIYDLADRALQPKAGERSQ